MFNTNRESPKKFLIKVWKRGRKRSQSLASVFYTAGILSGFSDSPDLIFENIKTFTDFITFTALNTLHITIINKIYKKNITVSHHHTDVRVMNLICNSIV
jgi:hypothetical protein